MSARETISSGPLVERSIDLRRTFIFWPTPVALVVDLLGRGEDGLGPAELGGYLPGLDALDGDRVDLALLVGELLVDQLALGLAQPLEHYLLGRLGGDAPGAVREALVGDALAYLGVRLEAARLLEAHLELRVLHLLDDPLEEVDAHLAAAGVELYGDVLTGRYAILAVGRDQRRLDRGQDYLAGQVALRGELGQRDQEIALHSLWRSLPARPAARSLCRKKTPH